MDFAILRLRPGDTHRFAPGQERALLVLSGEIEFVWGENKATVSRSALFDQGPWCLHLPSDMEATASARGGEVEIDIAQRRSLANVCTHSRLGKPFAPACQEFSSHVSCLEDTSTADAPPVVS
jgi:hypothetical protein